MSLWSKPQPLFTAKVPDLKKFYGKKVRIDGKKVRIETIVGSRFQTKFYEINGEYLMNMLRFHMQMAGVEDELSEQQYKDFEQTEGQVEKLPDPDTKTQANEILTKVIKDVTNEQVNPNTEHHDDKSPQES